MLVNKKVVMTIEKLSEGYEYSSFTKLTGSATKYITIPSSIILNTELDSKRVAVFTYLRIIKGLDEVTRFIIPSLIRWCGMKPDTRSNGVSQKFIDIINSFKDMGYLTYYEELSKTGYIEAEYNSNKIFDECQTESFAVLYLDEIKKIMSYEKKDSDKYFNNMILLLVFAFFRNVIFNRPNKLKLEERNSDGTNNQDNDIKARKIRSPEAYADTYMNIGEQLGITARMVSKAVSILRDDLELLMTDEAYHVKNEKGEFRTQYTIFANAYKREGEMLLASGESYYISEMERKAENIQKYNNKFIIDKNKRKSMKGE